MRSAATAALVRARVRLAAAARNPAALALAALVLVSIAFRVYALGRLPGLNGDEAWYGVQVERLLRGGEVAWRTPNGNVSGPLHFGVLLVLSAVLPPSFALLRVPSVLASIAQMALAWTLVRRHLGERAAAIAAVLTAALPVNIAFARLGWDPSDSGLVAILAAHFALAGAPVASALAFALALLVHPTNAFLAPFLVLAGMGAEAHRSGLRRGAVRASVHAALLAGALAILSLTSSSGSAAGLASRWGDRVADPRAWGEFAVLYARFLTGDTVYASFTGTGLGAARSAADIGIALLALGLLALALPRLVRERSWVPVGVLAGWAASVLAFFVLAGPHAMRLGLERYALCLAVPTVLALAVLLASAAERDASWRAWAPAAALAALALAGFGIRYLAALELDGSTSHETYWTGPVEPKEEAFRRIVAEAERHGGASVVPESFWLQYPLAYLAAGTPVTVREAAELRGPPAAGGTYFVGFSGGPLERWASGRPDLLPRWDVPGAAGRTAVRVWWVPPGFAP